MPRAIPQSNQIPGSAVLAPHGAFGSADPGLPERACWTELIILQYSKPPRAPPRPPTLSKVARPQLSNLNVPQKSRFSTDFSPIKKSFKFRTPQNHPKIAPRAPQIAFWVPKAPFLMDFCLFLVTILASFFYVFAKRRNLEFW